MSLERKVSRDKCPPWNSDLKLEKMTGSIGPVAPNGSLIKFHGPHFAPPGSSWLHLAPPGSLLAPRFRQSLAPPGSTWLVLAPPGSSWLLLAPLGSSWLLLAPPGSSWLLLAPSGSFWFLRSSWLEPGGARRT